MQSFNIRVEDIRDILNRAHIACAISLLCLSNLPVVAADAAKTTGSDILQNNAPDNTLGKNAAGEPSMMLISASSINIELNEALKVGFGGDLEKGISMMDEVIKKAPGMALAYNDRGMLYYRASKLKLAETDLNKALELDSSDSQYWSNRGLVHMMQGSENDAVSDLDKAISISSKNGMALATRGAILMRRGMFEKAKADFDLALQSDPKSALNLNNRAMTKFQTGDQAGAIEDAEKALAIEPDSKIMKANLTLFKTMRPGQISVKAEAEYKVKNSSIGRDVPPSADKSADKNAVESGTNGTTVNKAIEAPSEKSPGSQVNSPD